MSDYDFICVGGGLGGLAGAVRARALGLSVVVLEKTPYLGGVAAYSGGDIWVPGNHLACEAGMPDSREDAMAYMSYVGGYGVPFDARVRACYIDTVAEAVRFYATDAGINFGLGTGPDAFFPQAPGSLRTGRSMDVSVDGVDLGPWYDLLRSGPYHDDKVRGADIAAARRRQEGDGDPLSAEEREDRNRRRFLARGRGLAGGFLKAAVEAGVDIHVNASVDSLCYEDGRVVGVTATVDGQHVEFRAARGVLLATGGYGQASHAAATEGLPEYAEQAPPILDGDAMTLIESTPATVIRAGFGYITLGYRSATDVHPGTDEPLYHPILDALARPHAIAVNPDGQRFGDESIYVTFTNAIGRYDSVNKRYRNYPTYAIVDDQFRQAGYEFGLGLNGRWPHAELIRADTIEDLARQLGLDPAALVATVKRFNQFCADGTDLDFHRGEVAYAHASGDRNLPNPNLGPIEKPPFWGCRCTIVGAGIYSHGLSIDEHAAVLSRSGKPVAGLFATGNAVAYVEVPGGYQSGIANGRNITYAYVAANQAAQAV